MIGGCCVHEELVDTSESSEPTDDLLRKLFEYGAAQLSDSDCAATPLLPGRRGPHGSAPTRSAPGVRVCCSALVWGATDTTRSRGKPGIFARCGRNARVGFETEEATEADETAYAEVVEYLRVGLLIVQQDLSRSSARLH